MLATVSSILVDVLIEEFIVPHLLAGWLQQVSSTMCAIPIPHRLPTGALATRPTRRNMCLDLAVVLCS